VLVLRPLGLGDFCTAVPALRGLRRAHPDHELVLAAPTWQAPLADMVQIDRLVPTEPLTPISRREAAPAVAVNLHGRGPQSTRLLIDLAPQRLIAFRHPELPETARSPRWRYDEREVHRWCRLLAAHDIPADPNDIRLSLPPVTSPVAGYVVVHPGAAAASRRWPPRRFAEVISRLVAWGERIALTGTADERPVVQQVIGLLEAKATGKVVDLCGRTTIEQLCAVVAGARLVISNDTGIAHLAYAYTVPTVVLFGPTSPTRWGPPPGPHIALWKGTNGDPHGTALDAGLAQIDSAEVLGAAATLLSLAGVP